MRRFGQLVSTGIGSAMEGSSPGKFLWQNSDMARFISSSAIMVGQPMTSGCVWQPFDKAEGMSRLRSARIGRYMTENF